MDSAQQTVADLQTYIDTHGITAELLRDVGDTPTVPAAAAVLGVAADQIIKTLLFLVEKKELPKGDLAAIVVISHGERRVDPKRLAAHLGVSNGRVKFAPPAVVLDLIGYPVGGVPPIGHKTALPVLLDVSVVTAAAQFGDVLYGGGGDHHTMLRITLTELMRVMSPTVVPLS